MNEATELRPVDLESYAGRLRHAMALGGVSVAELSAALGITYQAVSQALLGTGIGSNAMTARNNSIAARRLNVCPDWLATGDGDPHARRWPFGDAITPEQVLALPQSALIPAIDVLVAAFRRYEIEREQPNDRTSEAGPGPR
jgi:hypothetical protein